MFPEELDFFWFQQGIEMYSRNSVAMQLCWFNGDGLVSLSETISLRWKLFFVQFLCSRPAVYVCISSKSTDLRRWHRIVRYSSWVISQFLQAWSGVHVSGQWFSKWGPQGGAREATENWREAKKENANRK